jgi:glycosyltransferase involved in cell wall biosynthesis
MAKRVSFPIWLTDFDIDRPATPLEAPSGYAEIEALARIHGVPVAWADGIALTADLSAEGLRDRLTLAAAEPARQHLLVDLLATPSPAAGWTVHDLLSAAHPDTVVWTPLVTIAVCTRDRSTDLARCLDALAAVEYPRVELLVVDNAPRDGSTEQLVRDRYPCARYVREPRPGLDWARNRAIAEATGEIICFTDDDALVDPRWVRALVATFTESPEAMAVTGPVVPSELETAAQTMFEAYGGFGRGSTRSWAAIDRLAGEPGWREANSGKFGTGANMAFRRELFTLIGGFDPALDVGTPTGGGGDLDMFFRVVREGHVLVYEPTAIVHHRHRREYAELRRQLFSWGSGFVAHVTGNVVRYPEDSAGFARLMLWWLRRWIVGRWRNGRRQPPGYPLELIAFELLGGFTGPFRYLEARRRAARIARTFGPLPSPQRPNARSVGPEPTMRPQAVAGGVDAPPPDAVAVRTIDLTSGVGAIDDVASYAATRVFVLRHGRPLGSVEIRNGHRPIGALRVRTAIGQVLGPHALLAATDRDADATSAPAHLRPLVQALLRDAPAPCPVDRPPLASHVTASVVIATLDRPAELRRCLTAVLAQATSREVEIVVVDNNPASGLTPPVVSTFEGVRLVQEPRRGLAYARNAGFLASRGDIVVATDDDVVVPGQWLERLVAPFTCESVMATTGHVLPLRLDTWAQRLFELYGGLGRGFASRLFDRAWFQSFDDRAVPTWEIGATANAAFRASIFNHPEIGLMDESLGPGMPSGVGEDTYLFYKILKAGYSIAYEPAAYVWHQHRTDLPALRRQLYAYSKGHVAYHLTTLLRDGDRRALRELAINLPRGQAWRVRRWLRGRWLHGRRDYPLTLILLEAAGNLMGPLGLWRSRRRVEREGHSRARSVVDAEPAAAFAGVAHQRVQSPIRLVNSAP